MGRQSHAEPAQRHNTPPAPRPLPSDHLRTRYGTNSHICARCGQSWPCTFVTGADPGADPLATAAELPWWWTR